MQTQHVLTQAQRGGGDEGLPPLYHACLDGLQQLVNMVAKAKGCMPRVSVDAMHLGIGGEGGGGETKGCTPHVNVAYVMHVSGMRGEGGLSQVRDFSPHKIKSIPVVDVTM